MESVTPELLRRTRVSAGLSALLIAHWLFGNLYEEVVTAPQALLDPEPGALIGAFALGSPFWYYGPTLPAAVALVWILALRLRRGDRPGGFGAAGAGRPATWSLRAAVAVTLAAVAKVTLIVLVNPTFRDPNVSAEQVRATTVALAVGQRAGRRRARDGPRLPAVVAAGARPDGPPDRGSVPGGPDRGAAGRTMSWRARALSLAWRLVQRLPQPDPDDVAAQRRQLDRFGAWLPPVAGATHTAVDIGGLHAEEAMPEGAGTAGGGPAVLYLHGDGYTGGSLTSHRGLVSCIAAASGMPVLHLGYRLGVTVDGLRRSAGGYLRGHDPHDPLASPLFADLRDLPPLLVQVGGDEHLRDDAALLAERAAAAGTAVDLQVWPGMWHVWHLTARLLPEARAALDAVATFVRHRLGIDDPEPHRGLRALEAAGRITDADGDVLDLGPPPRPAPSDGPLPSERLARARADER